MSHLGGKLSLRVEGVQAADHNVSCLLQRHGLGRLSDGLWRPLLDIGVESYSRTVAVCGTAALRRWRRVSVHIRIVFHLDTNKCN